MTTPSNHYVSNKDLIEVCTHYRQTYLEAKANNKELPSVPDAIGAAIYKIATNLSKKFNFVGYTYRDEMVSDAIVKCITKAHNFDTAKSTNFLAFVSQISWNSFLERIKKENHQTSVKARLIREKMSHEFVQHASSMDDAEASNAFVEFLKENDALTDYYEERKKKIHPSLVHRNRTAYPVAKEQVLKVPKNVIVDIFSL